MKPGAVGVRVFLWAVAILLVASVSGLAGSERACSDATLMGTYAFTESGTIVEPGSVTVNVAAAGVFHADGKGNISVTDTASTGGYVVHLQLDFNYQVNPDCTGSAATVSNTPPEEAEHFNFIIIGRGREAVGIRTDVGTVLLIKAKKQFIGNTANGPNETGQQS